MSFSSLKKETLETRVYQELRTAIVKRRLANGERLIQDVLATQFGTSRIPVRDALKRLETEGLVKLDERGSYMVSIFGSADLEEVYGLRMILEPYAAGKAMERMTASDFEELAGIEQELREMADQQDIERYVHLNQAYHMTLYEFSQQRRLSAMIKSLWLGLAPLTPIAVPGQLERSVNEHAHLLQALREKQPAVVENLLRTHIQHAKVALQAHLETMES
ncbi:MAG TPA: GntR family transcriptional regulator [Ktedonobacteraceae bacterium]